MLAVLAGEIPGAEAARRNGVSALSVGKWKARFLDGGRAALKDTFPGPSRNAGTPEQRRLRLENEQLKLALAEATVQLRIWQRGAEYVDQVPSPTSRPESGYHATPSYVGQPPSHPDRPREPVSPLARIAALDRGADGRRIVRRTGVVSARARLRGVLQRRRLALKDDLAGDRERIRRFQAQ